MAFTVSGTPPPGAANAADAVGQHRDHDANVHLTPWPARTQYTAVARRQPRAGACGSGTRRQRPAAPAARERAR